MTYTITVTRTGSEHPPVTTHSGEFLDAKRLAREALEDMDLDSYRKLDDMDEPGRFTTELADVCITENPRRRAGYVNPYPCTCATETRCQRPSHVKA